MANISRINGFKPLCHSDGSPWNGATEVFYKAAGTTITDDMAIGDPVSMSTTAGTTGIYKGVPGCTLLTPGDGASVDEQLLGIIIGFKQDYSNLNRTFVDGADQALVYVCTDPTVLYVVQANAALPGESLHLNGTGIKTNAVNRTTGTSGWELDVATTFALAATATIPFRVERYLDAPDNEFNALYNKVVVSMNQGVRKAGVLGG